jgi:hypothetical protein
MRLDTMGFWPFGRDPANIEIASRVVTAATQSGHRVRGKLTLHFLEAQRQADADLAADRCAALAAALLREAPDHSVIGAEAQLSADLTAHYPQDVAAARVVELAALHVVGDSALSDELRRASGSSGTMAAVVPPTPPPLHEGASSHEPRPKPWDPAEPSSTHPPAPPVPAARPTSPSAPPPVHGAPPMRRRGSSQIRSIQALLMPPGTSATAMGQFVAPLVKDSAARLLIGFLRAHDLVAVRHVSIDDSSAEMLATLVPVSDAPPGGYEASRAGEIARWQTTLGQGVMFALQHEARVTSVYLAKDALARIDVMPALADAVVEAVSAAAFPDEAGLLAEVVRSPIPAPPDFVSTLAEAMILLACADDDPASVASALAPLLATVQDDLNVAAMIIKASSGG